MSEQANEPLEQLEENKLIAQRRAKLQALREQDHAFPNDFRRDALAGDLHARYDRLDNQALEAESIPVTVAGRMMSKRIMGKASFTQLHVRHDPAIHPARCPARWGLSGFQGLGYRRYRRR